jgi:ribonuclease VapC
MNQGSGETGREGSSSVLDSTAVLAVFFEERGAENVIPLLPAASISTVNVTEVVGVALRKGADFALVRDFLTRLALEVVPYSVEHALAAGSLEPYAKPFNLSLADRACLAVGLSLGRPVVTADRKWAGLPLDLSVKLIR